MSVQNIDRRAQGHYLLYKRLIQRLGHQRWFSAIGRRLSPIDRGLYRLTGGRVGTTGMRVQPTLLLTTIGRRTGKERTTPVMFLRDGNRFIVTCENFGQQRPAAWPLNLDANPTARVQVKRETFACHSRRVTDEELAGYWQEFVEAWPPHESYLKRSGVRHMFVLEQRSLGIESCTTQS